MKKVLILVNNNFLNDNRVMNIMNSFNNNGFRTDLIAAKLFKGLPIYENNNGNVYRIPLFSSLYSKKIIIKNVSSENIMNSHNKIINFIKHNKIRLSIVTFLNWLLFNTGALMLGLIIRPDIIYSNDLDTLTVGYLISKIYNKKIIYDSHELWLYCHRYKKSSSFHKGFWRLLQRKLIRKIDAVITTTNFRASILAKQYNVPKVNVIRNCPHYIEINKFNKFREEFPIQKDIPILLYQGLIHKRRGVFTIVDAVESIENVAVVFMGMGDDIGNLIKYIQKKKLENKMFVKDAVAPKELLEYTSSADIGLQLLYNIDLNHYSTISNKIFEYIMSGLCIVASDFPEISQIVKNNNLGKVVDPLNVSEIKLAIQDLVSNHDLLNIYKENSRKIRHLFTWENEEKELFKIIGNF